MISITTFMASPGANVTGPLKTLMSRTDYRHWITHKSYKNIFPQKIQCGLLIFSEFVTHMQSLGG